MGRIHTKRRPYPQPYFHRVSESCRLLGKLRGLPLLPPPLLPDVPSISSNSTIAQTNVKSVVIAATAFLPTANKTHASLIGVAAGALNFPPASTLGLSAYMTSKIAMVKTLEFLAAENPGLFVASVHPGMIDTGVFRKSGAKPEMLPMDSGEFMYMASLKGM